MYVGVGGAWRKVSAISTGVAGAWRVVSSGGGSTPPPSSGLSVSASPSSPSASRSTAGVATASSTANPSGGTGPYSYAWSQVSGDSMSIGSPNSATATFSGSVNGANGALNGQFQVRVTDATGATATANASVTLRYTGSGAQS